MTGRQRLSCVASLLSVVVFAPAGAGAYPNTTVVAHQDAIAVAGEMTVPEGQTTVLRIGLRLGHPIERDPEFLSKAPSYSQALAMDREQRWAEAAALYQQALVEIGRAFGLGSTPLLEQATTKIEVERRRSQTLAAQSSGRRGPGQGGPLPSSGVGALERGRLLRLKLMSVRAGTGVVPADLVLATERLLDQAQIASDVRAPRAARVSGETRDPRALGGDPEIRLLRCAVLGAAGDRAAARVELAHVARGDRADPARALAVALCAAALGRGDDAIASLAVMLDKVGPAFPSALLQLGQSAELYGDNDWDGLRGNPRFERLFH